VCPLALSTGGGGATAGVANAVLGIMIRIARPEDVAHLPDLERAAGAAFRNLGMASIADDDPPPTNDLLAYQHAGRAWVASDDVDQPIAYLVIDVVDETAHVEQISVHPDFDRQGLGRALLDTLAAWAARRGLTALTLTTFTDVPWNAPYYARLGFRVVTEDEWTPGLRSIRQHEAAIGLDAWPRVVMRRPVPSEAFTR
jgi:GNAT superfamily N-acetyltransferase